MVARRRSGERQVWPCEGMRLTPCDAAYQPAVRRCLRMCGWAEEMVVYLPLAGLAGRDVEVDIGLG